MTTTSGRLPCVAPGVELLGEYTGSGWAEPAHLVRRPDGRVIALSPLLAALVTGMDGATTVPALASRLSQETQRSVLAEDVDFLIANKLGPLGLVRSEGAPAAAPGRGHAGGRPLLGLSVRKAVVPRHHVERFAAVAAPLFAPGALAVALAAFAVLEAWLVFGRPVDVGVAAMLADPVLVVLVLALTAVGGAFHELGHGAAARYGGARPGAVGVGIYLVWPAFFSDMTDSYRLSRGGRLRVDLGGVYFNAVFMLLLAAAYALTGAQALLVAIVVQHVLVLKQFLPFLRFDGYYIVCDLTGVPDLFERVRPVLTGLVRERRLTGVGDLKRWVRAVVTAWVLVSVALIGASLALLGTRLPGIARHVASFANTQATLVAALMRRGDVRGLAALLRMAVLALPVVGLGAPLVLGAGQGIGALRRRLARS